MGVAEHPYYPSFGYQVSSYYAASSRFGELSLAKLMSGTMVDLLRLIDRAHELGLRVIMDVVHAHACTNEGEGLSRFDGSDDIYFKSHLHPEWRT
jgi:1,4-alpha-glucan branching enzyme